MKSVKFIKQTAIAVILACVCMFGCFAHSFVNADDNAQPMAIPAIAEPAGEIIDAEEPMESSNIEETVELVNPVYLDIHVTPDCEFKRYVSVNSYGQKLVKLEFDFADSDDYGTKYIRKLLSDLLGDIKDEQYVSDAVFYEFTNTTRGDKVLFFDKHPLGVATDLNSPYDLYSENGYLTNVIQGDYLKIAIELGDVPSLENAYVKQDLEVLYLSEEQYEKVLSSGLCRGSVCYADYDFILERDLRDYPNLNYGTSTFFPLWDSYELYGSKVRDFKKRFQTDDDKENYFTQWYNERVAPYIVE